MTRPAYYDSTRAQSYNAVYNFIISNRNYGKTWGAQKRAFVRGWKHGKRTLWVRRFKKEQRQALDKLYKSSNLCKFVGAEWYDKDTKQGNLKQNGRKFFCKRNGKWFCFLEVINLAESKAMRSADDIAFDTIVFVEFTTTVDEYRLFKGDEVTKFVDLFFSLKRESSIKCFFFGNKESVSNPYFNYFSIRPLPAEYEGIRTYRGGSILIEQINNPQKIKNEYDRKVERMLKGTPYGAYLGNEYKNAQNVITERVPKNSILYAQFDFNGFKFAIRRSGSNYYVTSKLVQNETVYCDLAKNKYRKERVLLKSHKKYFDALLNAYSCGKVKYTSAVEYESFLLFLNWLSI